MRDYRMTRLVQIRKGDIRRVALVDEPRLRLLEKYNSVYELAGAAIAAETKLSRLATQMATDESLDYDLVHSGRSDWRLLAPIDHPGDAGRCLISGTGLTHLGSASNRQAMHVAAV